MGNSLDSDYLGLVKDVLAFGEWQETRTQFRTKAIPFVTIQTRIDQGKDGVFRDFPLLTTKRVAFKTMATELEGFIKGITDKSWYQERGCKIWNEWANPEAVEAWWSQNCQETNSYRPMYNGEKAFVQSKCNDLGPIYGYQWRSFGQVYDMDDIYKENHSVNIGIDQLRNIVDTLHKNPNDRRMVCSAWNPNQMHMMALPPCHVLWNVVVINGVLNLGWYQRSCDLMLGVPFNIASYGLLMCLLCKESGLKPGVLHGTLANCHIYENQIAGAEEQLKRPCFELPSLEIKNFTDIFSWEAKNTYLIDYANAGKLDFGDVAV